jgi:hypothetical protein
MPSPLLPQRTRPRRSPSRPFTVACGPFVGMRDSLDPAAADPRFASLLENCYPQGQSAVVGRPGITLAGATFGAEAMQWVGQFSKSFGFELTVAIAGGEIYSYDWGTDTWTKEVSTANLTTASITLNDASRVAVTTFANRLIISDSAGNTPFSWDGTAGAGGLVSLTAAPDFYGPTTTYYGKLFGVMDSDRATLAWSDENDPETGYGTAEQWTLGQSGAGAITALVGTNEGLYVFRDRSITVIHGTVTEDFRTTGTRSGVSESVGTMSPYAIAVAEDGIYFLDADGRPHVLQIGGGVTPIWEDFRETCRGLNRDWLAWASAVYDPNTQLVRFAVPNMPTGATYSTIELCYSPFTSPPAPQAIFRGYEVACMGVAKDDDGAPVVLHGPTIGYVYRHGTPNGDLWDDELATGTAPIHHVVRAPYLGVDIAHDKAFHRFDATMRSGTSMTGLGVDYETPYGHGAQQSTTLVSSGSRWDVATWDADTWASDATDPTLRVGLNGQGRWIRPRVQHQQAGEQFGLSMIRVAGVTRSDEPNTP